MASPLTKKYKWPSEKGASAGDMAADFVPYISNLVNSFRKVPRPRAPKFIDPVSGTRVSLADARRQVTDQSRAADLSTQDLDAQTGAAIRVGNMANRFRALSDLNSREAQINAQLGQQTKSINAGIDAQNTTITNQYRDDLTNADLAQQRLQSENIANAADKFIAQTAVRDQQKLERDKATIYSKLYNPGVYNRLLDSLQSSGMDTSGYTRPFDSNWAKRGTPPDLTDTSMPATTPTVKVEPDQPPVPVFVPQSKRRKYMDYNTQYAAGGMLKVFSGDPKPTVNNSPVTPTVQFKRHSGLAGTNAMSDNIYAMDFDTNRMSSGIDMINSVVSSGMLPNQTEQDKVLRRTLDPEMYTYLYQFNQRPDLKGMTPEQRVQTFYNIYSNNPNIQAMKDNMRKYGYGPLDFYRGQPTTGVTPVSNIARKSYGGRLKPFA